MTFQQRILKILSNLALSVLRIEVHIRPGIIVSLILILSQTQARQGITAYLELALPYCKKRSLYVSPDGSCLQSIYDEKASVIQNVH